MRRLLEIAVVAGMMGTAVASGLADGAKAGQPVPGPYCAFVVTGDLPTPSSEGLLPIERQNLGDYGRVGKFHDFVTRFGLDPCVAVFTAGSPPSADQPLGKLFQALDHAVDQYKSARLHAWGVFLGLKDDFLKDESQSAQVRQIEDFAKGLQLKRVPLALDLAVNLPSNDRARLWGLTPESVTVVIYTKHVVQSRWDFPADKPIDDAAIQTILSEVKKLAGGK